MKEEIIIMIIADLINQLNKLDPTLTIGVNDQEYNYPIERIIKDTANQQLLLNVDPVLAVPKGDSIQTNNDIQRQKYFDKLDNHSPVLIIQITHKSLTTLSTIELKSIMTCEPYYKQLANIISSNRKIDPKRLANVKNAIVIFDKQIIATYGIGDKVTYDLSNQRANFELLLHGANTKLTQLVGSQINYLTRNPVTIKSYQEIKDLIVKE